MSWEIYRKAYKSFLQLEKSLSKNTVENYLRDLDKLIVFAQREAIKPEKISYDQFQVFLAEVSTTGVGARSRARLISGVKSFYGYLLVEEIIEENPSELLQTPKLPKKLPETLSVDEINKIIEVIDLSLPDGLRNKTILETLYGCGLRVSELVELKINQLYFKEDFIKILGKQCAANVDRNHQIMFVH